MSGLVFLPAALCWWALKIIILIMASTHIFYPFAIDTAGTWHEMAIELTQEIGRRIITIAEDTHGRQRSFSDAFPWLSEEEMRFLSTAPWSESKFAVATIILYV